MFNTFCIILQKALVSPVRPPLAATTRVNFSKYTQTIEKSSGILLKEGKENVSKTGEKEIFITLLGTDGIPKTSTLAAAQKLSKRRNLRLIKVSDFDPRREIPIYKLLTSNQALGEDITHKKQNKGKTGFKSEKIITFSYNISEHDLNSKVQNILKWIEKKHEVRATISGPSSENELTEETYQKIESVLKHHGRILQKRKSGTDIKFQIVPLKENKNVEGNDKTS